MGRTRTTVNKSSTKSPNMEKGNRIQRKFQISYDLFLTTEIHYVILYAGFYIWNHCNNSWRYNKTDFKSSQLSININELLNTNAVRTIVLKIIPSHQGDLWHCLLIESIHYVNCLIMDSKALREMNIPWFSWCIFILDFPDHQVNS